LYELLNKNKQMDKKNKRTNLFDETDVTATRIVIGHFCIFFLRRSVLTKPWTDTGEAIGVHPIA